MLGEDMKSRDCQNLTTQQVSLAQIGNSAAEQSVGRGIFTKIQIGQ